MKVIDYFMSCPGCKSMFVALTVPLAPRETLIARTRDEMRDREFTCTYCGYGAQINLDKITDEWFDAHCTGVTK